jgi:DNA-binding response OmpR family regulator
MRLLLAEDDAALGRATSIYMMRDGHPVDWVTNGNRLLELMAQFEYDCIVLDLSLPELSGGDCLVNLRSRANHTPVIVTTAQSARELRVKLLDIGADDYLVKPYDLAELAARIRSIVRRSRRVDTLIEGRMSYGALTLVPASVSVIWHGEVIVLPAKEFAVLEALLRRRGRVVTRPELEAEVYGWNEAVTSNAVEVHIHHLRRKLDANLIITIRGEGYRIESM